MLLGKKVLAVVPARSGSKGIPNKNMRMLGGRTLIGHAGACLSQLAWVDEKIISTDCQEYAEEGRRCGLSAPFLRPSHLSTDNAGAVETITHALLETEKARGVKFDIILIIEPTSPLRKHVDIESATSLLIESGADSVVTVSILCPRSHPHKILKIQDNKLRYYTEAGQTVVARQSLDALYWRNGICYALTRECLLTAKKIFTENTKPFVILREIVNIDDPIDLEWAEFLLERTEHTTIKENG
jgi:CMP-N,N'-diacetyllegionaminic acid synthase